ncbi:MAG: M16 family metallopeptidase [Bacteroidales bacterium]|jgi:predicted Zn-dependent peptidase|nr:insulinase family protein [Bacteroidales bacterium]
MRDKEIKGAPKIITPSAGDTSLPEPVMLGNGVPVYLAGNGTVDLLRIEFVFPAGQVLEEVHLAASTTSAMLTEGTLHHDAATINDLIDSTGATLSHAADKDTAGLTTVTLTRKLNDVMALASEVLFSPSFPENEFRILTDRRLQAFQTSRQKTPVIAREAFYEALCGAGSPYGRITTEDDYRRLTTGDLREFHRKHYRPVNMYVTVAGSEPWKALPVLEKHFSVNGTEQWQKPPLPSPLLETSEPGKIFREVPSSVQSTIRVGWKGITRNHPDYQALQVATVILGGYFGSRLMRTIREEKGYTYGIGAVAGAFHNIGYITIMTDVANAYRDDTLREIRKEVEKLRTEEVSGEEMTLVRNHMMGGLARAFDGPFLVADALRGVIDYETGSDYYTRLAETVKTITPARIMDIFDKYFNPDEAWEIIAGSR